MAESTTKIKPPNVLERAKEERLAQKESRLNGPPKLPTQAPPPDTHEEVSSLLDRIAGCVQGEVPRFEVKEQVWA